MRRPKHQGQQIMEALLLFVAVVVVLVTFVKPNGLLERSVDNVMNMAFNVMASQNASP